ncbi:IncQ plasmid conjugative transfer protein TraP [Vibrio astriarenae]|nr:IncQ plasmid conjugative transfer protein TraP [Vibrio sp. C7]
MNLVTPRPLDHEEKVIASLESHLLAQAQHQQKVLDRLDALIPATNHADHTFVVRYGYNETRATTEQIKPLLIESKSACRVELRARTDGAIPTTQDKAVAKARAVNLRDQLVNYGVDSQVITLNYAASTDYADNNWTEEGRANNRRVEVDIFQSCHLGDELW